MGAEYFEGIHRVKVDSIATFQLRDGPEERVISGNWELPVSLFIDAGYAREQIVEGMDFQYKIRKQQGEPLKAGHFKGILPLVESVDE